MNLFLKSCHNKFTDACIDDILYKLSFDKKLIKKCIDESFIGDNWDMDDNTILKEDLELLNQKGIMFYPSI